MFNILELKVKYSMLRSIANGSFGMVYQMQNKVNRHFMNIKMKTGLYFMFADHERVCGGQAPETPKTRRCVFFSQRISYFGEGMRRRWQWNCEAAGLF